ncbi:MAG TPA: LarC family nickel insertion protein [Actinomycetaceae bacterium]|nr:LarC family nickel insertion protein [Actinomycetaceae bacterium]
MGAGKTMWIDASNGVAGDMLLGALVDAGAPLEAIQSAVDSVVPGSVRLRAETVTRAGMRATKVHVDVLVEDPPHRTWRSIRERLLGAELTRETRERAYGAFERLAIAEAHVHGTSPEDVHFHEVGALDSIADTVGVCEAVRLLGVDDVVASPVALGSGFVRAAHGRIPVPVPAVAELALGWPVVSGEDRGADADAGGAAGGDAGGQSHAHSHRDGQGHGHVHEHSHGDAGGHAHAGAGSGTGAGTGAGGVGELATPTGMALIRALARESGPIPAMVGDAVGVGAGTKDFADHPNVVRVVVGRRTGSGHGMTAAGSGGSPDVVHQLECNVDDLDPRLWPGVLEALLAAGALDAWLSAITMKRGRPAHTLHALAPHAAADAVADAMLATTTTLGVRRHQPLHRVTLQRGWVDVLLGTGPGAGRKVPVKVAHDRTAIRDASPEFRDVAALAAELRTSELEILDSANAAASHAGLVRGAPVPEDLGPAPA